MSSPKEILRKYRIFPSKKLGQNFLIWKDPLKKMVEAGKLKEKDLVLEIGPGIGNLTLLLAKRVKKVIAVEKDRKMVEILKEVLDSQKIENVEVFNEDILDFLTSFDPLNSYKVFGNIPYYLTSRLLRNLLELKKSPKLIVLMVQKEVAQRIVSRPPKMNLLAVSVQFYSKPKIISFVPKEAFCPKPKVDSAIVKIVPKPKKIKEEGFFRMVKIGFSHPRKQLINNFSKKLGIEKIKLKEWFLKSKIDPEKRAQELFLEDWLRLAKNLKFL
jgi:16S rRNA (adenine1518-N6/adenine1519-N6)-dimethyltransferase